MSRRHDTRRIKQRRTYTIAEAAQLMKVGKPTVYNWVVEGLAAIVGAKPLLIHGAALKAFLDARNKPRQPLACNQIYCVACKAARRPVADVVGFIPLCATNGNIVGECPSCRRRIFRRVRTSDLAIVASELTVHREDVT